MLLSLNWLKDYIDIDKTPTEVASMLSETGTHAESVIEYKSYITGVKTAKILKITKHENADKLVICDVDFGDRKDVIVTAAKNMKENDIVGVATPGAILADGTKIEPHDFRGVISNGMFVSFEEIGFSKDFISKEDQNGILILPEDTKLGIDLIDALKLEGVIEFEITPNRPDCMSVLGLAYESAATFDKDINDIEIAENIKETDFKVSVNSENVSAYNIGIIKNIEVKESPLWIKTRLMESGIRPVNNIVDITNYIMIETGIPMHAFDLDKLGNDITVVDAIDSNEIELLDDRKVKTDKGDILITSNNVPVALAGVMGLKNSEITNDTKNVLIEGADFNRVQIKATGKRLDINSEAKIRFQKELSSKLPKTSTLRALKLFSKLGFNDLSFKEVKRYDYNEKIIKTRPEKIKSLIGKDIDRDFIIRKLNLLGVRSEFKDAIFYSYIPSFRPDLNIEADIIEEIGRLYLYKNVESKPISTELSVGYETDLKKVSNKIRHFFKSNGFIEALTYSFIGPKLLNKIEYNDDKSFIKIINPLGEEFSVMRPTFNAHFLELAEKNFKRSNGPLKVFEIGHVFKKDGENDYKELNKLAILEHINCDFYDLRKIIFKLLGNLGIHDYSIKRAVDTFYHPGRSAEIFVDGVSILRFGQVHPNVASNFDLKEVFLADVDLDAILPLIKANFIYQAKSKFQDVRKEISFVVKDDVMYGDIKDSILSINSEILKDVYFYDIYKDESLNDKKSITIGLDIGHNERTLVDKEIKDLMDQTIELVKNKFDAKLR